MNSNNNESESTLNMTSQEIRETFNNIESDDDDIDNNVNNNNEEDNTENNNNNNNDNNNDINDNNNNNTDNNNNNNNDNNQNKKIKLLYKSQVRKPTGKWILYTQDHRKELQLKNPTLTAGDISKILKTNYHNMTEEESNYYNNICTIDKERYSKEISEAIDDTIVNNNINNNNINSTQLALPIARVKRTIRIDPDVKALSKDSLIMITKLTELFIGYFSRKSYYTVSLRGNKIIKEADVIQTIYMNDNLEFLRLDFPRKNNNNNKTPEHRATITTTTTSTVKSNNITTYFKSDATTNNNNNEEDIMQSPNTVSQSITETT